MLKALLVTGAATALVGGVAVAGNAAQTPSSPTATLAAASTTPASADTSSATTGERLKERCEDLPLRIQRTQALEKRLAGNASTKGSIAYLQARIDKARAAGDDALAAALEKRLEFRKALAGFLPHRLDLLNTASTTICSAPGTAGGAAS
jgi:hypothetical protein